MCRPNSADSESGGRGLGREKGKSSAELSVELSEMKSELRSTQKQLDGVRAKLSSSNAESKKLKSVLVKELGSSVDLNE